MIYTKDLAIKLRLAEESLHLEIGDIYTRFGICMLAVGFILEGVSKLIENLLAVSLVG